MKKYIIGFLAIALLVAPQGVAVGSTFVISSDTDSEITVSRITINEDSNINIDQDNIQYYNNGEPIGNYDEGTITFPQNEFELFTTTPDPEPLVINVNSTDTSEYSIEHPQEILIALPIINCGNFLILCPDISNNIHDMNAWIRYGQPHNIEKGQDFYTTGIRVDASNIGAGVQQRGLNVEAGETYQIRFKYNLEQGRLFPKLGDNDSNIDFEGNRDRVYPTDGEWKEYTRVFTAPESEDFRIVFAGKDAIFSIDDVIIELYDDRNLVKDGDMKLLGTDEWRYWNNKTAFAKENGYMAINATGISAGFQQLNLPVEAGKEYRLSFDYEKLGGKFRTILGIRTSNSDFEKKYDFFPKTYNGQWRPYERTFTVPEDFNGDFRLVFLEKNGIAHVDNVRIEEVVEEAPVIMETAILDISANESAAVIGDNADGGEVILGGLRLDASNDDIRVSELAFTLDSDGLRPDILFSEVYLFDESSEEVLETIAPYYYDDEVAVTFHIDETIDLDESVKYTVRGVVNVSESVNSETETHITLQDESIEAMALNTGIYLEASDIVITR